MAIGCSARCECGAHLATAVAQHGLKRMAPGAAVAGVDLHGDTDAREQRPARIDLVKLEAYRQTLDDLDPIAGRVLGRQDREIRSGARTHADDMGLEGAIRISVDVDCGLLTRTHVGQAGFAEIRLDPDASARHHREHGGAGIDEVADLQVIDPCHNAIVRRVHRRVGQIEPSLVELGLGCADRRMAIDLDIRIAVQRGHGVGDLLCGRCDVLTGDLEIHVGLVIDLARCPTVRDERFPSRILTLVEVLGSACRLKLGQLLAVGGLELIDLETCAGEPRLGLIDGNLVRFWIDLEQELRPAGRADCP